MSEKNERALSEKWMSPQEVRALGVREHTSMVDFSEIHEDGCIVFESRVLPYRNIEECRELMRQTHKRNFEKMMAKYFPEEQNENN